MLSSQLPRLASTSVAEEVYVIGEVKVAYFYTEKSNNKQPAKPYPG